MSTSAPQTSPSGIRLRATAAPEPARASRGPKAVLDAWNQWSVRTRVLIVAGVVFAVTVLAGVGLWRSVNRPVALYPSVSAEDVEPIAARLTTMNVAFTIQSGQIMVDPNMKPRIVGALLAYGFPRWHPSVPAASPGYMPMGDSQRREQAIATLRADLSGQIRQFECVSDAVVNIAVPDNDSLTPGTTRASVLLSLRPGMQPSRSQVQALVSLMVGAVTGLAPQEVRVTDTTGRLWNDGLRVLADDEASDDPHINIKRAYENAYGVKLKAALDRVFGDGNYAFTVNAVIDFSQVKIVQTSLDGPGGDGHVTTLIHKDEERYDAKKGPYVKLKIQEKVETGRIERTAIGEPGVVDQLSASIALDGQHSEADVETARELARGALGTQADVVVRCIPLIRPVALTAPAVTVAPTTTTPGDTRHILLLLALAPSLLSLAGLFLWLARTREAHTRRAGLELRTSPDEDLKTITDLITSKRGEADRQARTATHVNALESMAREGPTRVAELLRTTWLSQRER